MSSRSIQRALAILVVGGLAACSTPTAPPPAPQPPTASTARSGSVPAIDAIAPNEHLRADGMPAIPRSIAQRADAYTDFRPFAFVDWHPVRREMLVRHRPANANIAQLHLLRAPDGKPEQLTDSADVIGRAEFEPRTGRYVVYTRDTGGNEETRVYRLDLESRSSTPVSAPDVRSSFTWTRAGDRLLIESVPVDRTSKDRKRDTIATTLRLVDPLDPERGRTVTELPGTGWFGFRFAPNDRSITALEYKSATESAVWTIDVESGRRVRLLPRPGDTRRASYSGFEYSPDGRTLYLTTDRFGEFRELAAYDFATHKLRRLSSHMKWNAEDFRLSEDGQRLFVVFNVDGVDEGHWFDARAGRDLGRVDLPAGSIGSVDWHKKLVHEVAVSHQSPQSAGDVWTLDSTTGHASRWTHAISAIDTSRFPAPEVVRWTTFDGRTISGLLALPPSDKFPGKRPVLVSIHGGPEGQAKVAFLARNNYFLNELGIALLFPNVRGSSGYGKTFLDLDNGVKREDSVRDIGSLLDWIPSHPRLDPTRVAVYGGSYGGYMVLASAVHYSDRLKAAVDIVGISNFATFLNHTESYRRDLRRVEYGDERDPAIRAFFDRISPLNNAERIRVPLFVVQGRNDPRVPYTEAEQIVQRVRGNGGQVWYLLADNEGHGFARKANADFQFYATVRFLEQSLVAP